MKEYIEKRIQECTQGLEDAKIQLQRYIGALSVLQDMLKQEEEKDEQSEPQPND